MAANHPAKIFNTLSFGSLKEFEVFCHYIEDAHSFGDTLNPFYTNLICHKTQS